jgi:pilus assembly protein Flp/PilA
MASRAPSDKSIEARSGETSGNSMMNMRLKAFFSDRSGATAIEYALIASLIAIAIVSALTNLGARLSAEFSEVSRALK